ncbi:MAG: serine/threonine protein kinase [Planctomycetes bacterium]|nr:serine/threonine protein kinase [Planctomycetota bacterium]
MAEQLGPFLLDKKLGGGGMGVVYRATYIKTGKIVALKLLAEESALKPKNVARFERELAILQKLKHPHIVRCYWGGKLEDKHAMAMELLDGGTLADELKKRGRIPWEEVIRIGRQICAALECAHSHGIIHRDLKPSNVLLAKDGTIKLADFGIARDNDATALTAAGKTVGTFAYMPPEQIRGDRELTAKADLYALGCMLFELLTGSPPFDGQSAGELLMQHMEKKPGRVSASALDCPVWFDAVLLQLLEKDPEKRPRDAQAVAMALSEVQTKVEQQVSVVTHAASGMPTGINMTTDGDEARKLLKKKKSKKGESGPIYERTWFLVLCLAPVIGLLAWTFWPKSEDTLLAKARLLMESDDPLEWNRAHDLYLVELQQRFPNGKSAPFVAEAIDRIQMRKAEDVLKNRMRLGKDLTSEGERLYAQASKYEQFGDRVTALEMYNSMIHLLGEDSEARPFVNLARRQKAQIESASDGTPDKVKLVTEALKKADELYQSGQVVEANKKWTSIVSLYEQNREFAPLVKRARKRLAKNFEPDDEETPAEQ